MSQLVLDWLNKDVCLSRKVKIFERDFANGYLFGELLYKHGLLQAFEEEFVDESHLAAKRQNFSMVQQALREAVGELGVKLPNEQVEEIMDEDRGSSLRILYQLRRVLSTKAKGSVPSAKATAGAGRPRLQKQVKTEEEENFFDQRVNTLRPIDQRYPYEVHNKAFVDEHTRQLRSAREKEYEEMVERSANVQEFRVAQQRKMESSRAQKELARKAGEQHWQGVQEKKYNLLEKDLNFEKEMIRRDQQRIVAIREHYAEDCGFREGDEDHGIAWFEKNLQRIGIDTSEHSGSDTATIEAATLKELHEKMKEKLPSKARLQIESAKRMEKIRDTKRQTDIARKERERRQRRVQYEQAATTAAVEAKKKEEDLLTWLLTETAKYRQEAAEYDFKLRRKQAQWEQREAKQLAYAQRAAVEQDEAWNRMAEKAREERQIKQRYRSNLPDTEGAAEEASSDDDGAPVEPGATTAAVEKKRSERFTSESVSVKGSDAASAAPVVEIAPSEEVIACVRETLMTEYLFFRGAWAHFKPSEEEALGLLRGALGRLGETSQAASEPRLGSVVQWLCKSSTSFKYQAPPRTRKAQLASDFLPVLAVVGSPVGLVSGRSTALCNSLVDRLSQELGYAVLRPSEVVSECIALSEKPPQEPDWPILARMRELGKDASQGSGVSPGVQAEMLFRKIELLSAPAPKPVEEEDPKKKPKGKDKKEEVPEPVRPKGILVLGYPAELRQLASWEAALRGFTSSLLQLMDSEESQQARLGSLLAPFWVEGESATPVVKAEERELAKAAEKADFDPEFAPPVRIVRLRYPDEATLLEAVQKEDMSAEGRANEGESRLCHGLEEEMATMQCAADQAWLFESAQVFATKLSAPLHNVHDVLVQDGEEGDDVIPAAEAILKRIRELVAFWHRPILEVETADADAKPDEAVEAPEAEVEAETVEADVAPPEGPEGDETAEPPASEDAGDKEAGQPTEGKDEAEDLEQEAVNTLLIKDSRQTKEAFQNLWLQNMSHYLLGIRETLLEVDDHASSYCKDLIFMQRRFLEFLQRPDDKAQVLEEFLRGFPVRNNVPPGSRQADELSEQLQDLADRLWVHANLRKQEAVEERYHQMTGGFWEEKAAAQLRLAHKLQALELARFKVAAAVLRWTYCQVDQDLNCFDTSAVEPPPADLSSLQDLATWLDESAERFGSAEPSGVEEEVAQAENELPQADSLPEEDSSLLEASASQIVEASSETSELVAALKAERHGLVSRCRCIAAWTYARLETMHQQHEEVFARMDDWIKDRVKEENEAIKATDTLLRSGRWEDEEPVFMTTRSMRRSQTTTMKPALTGAAGKRRRDVLKVIIAKTLDVDVYIPQKLEVSEAPVPVPTRPSTSNSQAVGSRPSTTKPLRPVFPERWSQDMLWGLLTRLADLSGAVCSAEQLLQALLERRHCALGFNNEQVIPESWVMRPLVVYKLLCDSIVEPAWGATGVDVTEFLLVLSHHENSVPWPTPEALEETRAFLQSEESPLDQDVLASYPDVPISEELFCQLPLWPETCQPELRRWIFQVLATFADQEQVRLPAKPSRRPEDPSEFTITARRIFGYFALGHSPAESFSRLCRLLLPREALAAEEEPAQVLVKDLWTLLHSQRSRPSGLIAPVPDLAIFCNNLLEEAKAETAAAAAPKGKAAPKPKGKAKQEVEEEVEPPPLPEEATVAFSEKVLLQRKTVLRAFCSHGGLLCRRRGLEVLFPTAGSGWSLATSSQAAALQELQSLVPEATAEEEEAPA